MRDLADALRAEVERASALFRAWGEAEVTGDRGPGEWVRKEILGHLIDSAVNNHQRFVRARFGERFEGPGYDQDAWVAVHRYRERPWAELVELWVLLNRQVAAAIESVPLDKLQTPCSVGGQEPRPLLWWITDYLGHLKHHIDSMIEGG